MCQSHEEASPRNLAAAKLGQTEEIFVQRRCARGTCGSEQAETKEIRGSLAARHGLHGGRQVEREFLTLTCRSSVLGETFDATENAAVAWTDSETARFCGVLLEQLRVHTLRVYSAAMSSNTFIALAFVKLISWRGTEVRSDGELLRTIFADQSKQVVSGGL